MSMIEISSSVSVIRPPLAPAQCATGRQVATVATPMQQQRTEAAIASIDAAIGRPLYVRAIAAQLGVSTRTLYEAFIAVTGCSPYQYVLQQKFLLARDRLRAGGPKMLVKTVALDLGFNHLGNFGTRYRALFGETPLVTLQRARRLSPVPLNTGFDAASTLNHIAEPKRGAGGISIDYATWVRPRALANKAA